MQVSYNVKHLFKVNNKKNRVMSTERYSRILFVDVEQKYLPSG